jgi:hypothetical protein
VTPLVDDGSQLAVSEATPATALTVPGAAGAGARIWNDRVTGVAAAYPPVAVLVAVRVQVPAVVSWTVVDGTGLVTTG